MTDSEGKILLIMGGGLGDVLIYYLAGDLGYLEDWKRQHPNGKSKLFIKTTNDQVSKLFEFFPHVDVLQIEGFQIQDLEPGRADQDTNPHGPIRAKAIAAEAEFVALDDGVRESSIWNRQRIFLSEEEQQCANEILAAGPYVVIHPYAGTGERDFDKNGVDPKRIIEGLCRCGIRVVLLGGSSFRTDNGTSLKENCGLEMPGLINLVGKHTVRLHAYLTQHASKFIGSVSAYNCVAHCCEIPSLVFAPKHLQACMRDHQHGIFWMMQNQKTKVHFWNEPDLAERSVKYAVEFAI